MHILYLHQQFQTREGFTGNRSYEFSKYLLKQAHTVTMICSGIENEPRLTVPAGQNYFQTEVDGIQCVPLAAALANPLHVTRLSGAARMWRFLQFSRLAKSVGKKLARPDVVFATSTPLTIGLAGMDLARHFKVPFVFEVRDLWPQALINIGALTNPLAIWWMRRMERRIYHAAQHLVALSPGMRDGIVRTGIPAERVTMIPNGSDLDLFRPDLDPGDARQRLGIGNRFAAIYFGAMGHANNLGYAVEAARILRDRGDRKIVLVLHGHGKERPDLEQYVRNEGLDNVLFSDPVPDKGCVARLVAACDVCLTIYRATNEQTWSPNKMFDALAAGRPVLINVGQWLGETIESNRCGYSVDPQHPAALADALQRLAASPELCAEFGRHARQLAERDFAREKLAAQLEAVLQSVCR